MTAAPRSFQGDASRLGFWIRVLLVFVVSVSVFWMGRNLTLDWTDEGHIIYPIWRVSRGALPYRDLRELYAPSLFFLDGMLFRFFGADLSVIRVSLVFLKAGLMVLVYLNARLVARPRFALAVCALGVAVFAAPWWVFNTPYANHYALFLDLAGIYGFLRMRRRIVLSCFWAGLFFGAAATFKQTGGIFAFVALMLFLLWERGEGDPRGARPGPASRMIRLVRWAVLIGSGGLCIAYLAPRNTAWNLFLLASPTVVILLVLARRELHAADARSQLRRVTGVISAGLGMAVPLLAYAAYYASQGQLAALIGNTITELPHRIHWFDPLPTPVVGPAGFALSLLLFLLAVRLGATAGNGRLRVAAAACLVGSVACVGAVLGRSAADVGLAAYLSRKLWEQDLVRTLYALPFIVVWISLWGLLRPGSLPARDVEAPFRDARVLLSFFSAVSLLFLYPSGDFWHLLMGLPAFLPLAAYLLEQYATIPLPTDSVRYGRAVLAAGFAVIAILCWPFLDTLRFSLAMQPGIRGEFRRATGITGWPPKFGEAADLVAYLDGRSGQQQGLFIVCVEPMLYFLAARPSVLEADEFAFYLVGAGAIERDDAETLVSESRMIERLRDTKPMVIDYEGSPLSARFRSTFSQTSRFLDSHFRQIASFGGYRVYSWAER